MCVRGGLYSDELRLPVGVALGYHERLSVAEAKVGRGLYTMGGPIYYGGGYLLWEGLHTMGGAIYHVRKRTYTPFLSLHTVRQGTFSIAYINNYIKKKGIQKIYV